MRKTLAFILSSLFLTAGASAQQPLDDAALSDVSGADGVNFAMHLSLNDQALPNPSTDSRISMGFNVDGHTTHVVVRNPRGVLDVFGLSVGVEKKPDGTDYIAIGLPAHVRYTDFGFESLSVQSDPAAPVTDSLGRLSIQGTVNMQGQLRMWAH
ncbi:hypothetical protein [Noviherbaspirillum denitrificans]|uniref:Uncharacterized protein n=1 Tax=Noviherbaspirillum denitrificans TaxID=1968433 RepID=A0A254TEN5_9BURK|nr:hypothetical protein [Noviherbaspirillum denitrificans]OWW20995.1 hypothetical protein AYR66_17475 [Noviherbaspirillum denitrificans]